MPLRKSASTVHLFGQKLLIKYYLESQILITTLKFAYGTTAQFGRSDKNGKSQTEF